MSVTKALYCDESVRDAFIRGLQSLLIRQSLLENRNLNLANMFQQARAIDSVQKKCELYSATQPRVVNALTHD